MVSVQFVVKVLYLPFTYSAIAYFVAPGIASHSRVAVPFPVDETSGLGALGSLGAASTKSSLPNLDHFPSMYACTKNLYE